MGMKKMNISILKREIVDIGSIKINEVYQYLKIGKNIAFKILLSLTRFKIFVNVFFGVIILCNQYHKIF